MISAASACAIAFKIFATCSGRTVSVVSIKIPRSAPSAIAPRICSCASFGPIDTTTISETTPASCRRTASSTAISSNGFTDILTLVKSTPVLSAFTRTFTL